MKAILKAYWPTVRKYKWSFAIATLFMALIMLSKAAYPFLLRDLLDGLNGVPTKDVWQTFCLMILLVIASNAVAWVFEIAKTSFDTKSKRDLDQRSFAAVQAQSMRFFEGSIKGALSANARKFSEAFENFTDVFMYQLGRNGVMILATLCAFLWQWPLIALIFGVWLVVFIGTCWWFAKWRLPLSIDASKKDSRVSGGFGDSFENYAAVKSFAMEREEQRRFNKLTEDSYESLRKSWTMRKMLMRIQMILLGVFELLVIYILIRGWQAGTVTVGEFVFFQAFLVNVVGQVWDMSGAFHQIFRYVAQAMPMAEVYALVPEVQDAPGARPLIVNQGEIEFHAVDFRYTDQVTNERGDISDFSLRIAPGKTVAIVGRSGAGKSTIAKLLSRQFDVDSGMICIDGYDIANVTQVSLRQQIAVVPQDPCLFDRSLRDNIAFARPDATEQEIIEAAKRARIWEFIQSKPQGLDTIVGERGVKLSGGEKQRVALARAFLADAPILVLDEATSSLDSETEHEIQSITEDLLRHRTCIVIAHRLSTVCRADTIIVMEKGVIKEVGTHKELRRKGGIYANLWAHQSGGYIG
jgi:ATP-binding cassette subfamily B protein